MKLKNIEVGKRYQLKTPEKRKEVDYFISTVLREAPGGAVVTVDAIDHGAEVLNTHIKYGTFYQCIPAQWLKRIKEEV